MIINNPLLKEKVISNLAQGDYSKKVFFETMINILIKEALNQQANYRLLQEEIQNIKNRHVMMNSMSDLNNLAAINNNLFRGYDEPINSKNSYQTNNYYSKKDTGFHPSRNNKNNLLNSYNSIDNVSYRPLIKNNSLKKYSHIFSSNNFSDYKVNSKNSHLRNTMVNLRDVSSKNPKTEVKNKIPVYRYSGNKLIQLNQISNPKQTKEFSLNRPIKNKSLPEIEENYTRKEKGRQINTQKLNLMKFDSSPFQQIKKSNLHDIQRLTKPTVSSINRVKK